MVETGLLCVQDESANTHARRTPSTTELAARSLNPRILAALLSTAMLIAACSGSSDDDTNGGAGDAAGRDDTAQTATDTPSDAGGDDRAFPDVVGVEVERSSDDTYDFAVTISSPYDTPERYADGWRIVGPDGTVYGTHQLAHDHAAEQPFTRTQSDVRIPDGVDEVVVEGHDLANGYGGETATVAVPEE